MEEELFVAVIPGRGGQTRVERCLKRTRSVRTRQDLEGRPRANHC